MEKEAFAAIWALKRFRNWIFGKPVTIYTDHNPLTYLTSSAPSSAKLTRWALAIQQYDVTFCYKAGQKNVAANCLSWAQMGSDGAPAPQEWWPISFYDCVTFEFIGSYLINAFVIKDSLYEYLLLLCCATLHGSIAELCGFNDGSSDWLHPVWTFCYNWWLMTRWTDVLSDGVLDARCSNIDELCMDICYWTVKWRRYDHCAAVPSSWVGGVTTRHIERILNSHYSRTRG